MQKQHRIGIDCRLAGAEHAGIGRYLTHLVNGLVELNVPVTWVCVFRSEDQAKKVLGDRFSKVEVVYTSAAHYSIAEQWKLPGLYRGLKLDLLHVPHFNVPFGYSGKMIVTIHDLLWHEYRGTQVTTLSSWQYWIKYAAYRWTVDKAVAKARKILVPTHTIQDAILKYYPKAGHKVLVTLEGIDPELFKRKARTGLPLQKRLIYVGSLYPHKNIRVVLDALAHLKGYSLDIIGARNVFQDKVQRYVKEKGLEHRVQFLGYVSDQDVSELYATSTALVQPSLSEGFGLTGVEAMAAGIPVLASDIPIFREVYGKAAVFFDPHSSESFAEKLRGLEKQDRNKIIQSGKEWAKQYQWSKMIEQTWQAYQLVLNT